jgi:ParB/RepB/Spo0J family partition protein
MAKRFVREFPIADIQIAEQVRKQFDDIEELAESLRALGQQVPIKIRYDDGLYVVTDGERRLLGAKLLGWETIEAIVHDEPLKEDEVIAQQWTINSVRQRLSPMEQCQAILRYMELRGLSKGETAKALGIPGSTLSRKIGLRNLPKPVQDQVEAGTITASDAYKASAKKRKKKSKGRKRQSLPGTTIEVSNRRSVTINCADLTIDLAIVLLDEAKSMLLVAKTEGKDLDAVCQAQAKA